MEQYMDGMTTDERERFFRLYMEMFRKLTGEGHREKG